MFECYDIYRAVVSSFSLFVPINALNAFHTIRGTSDSTTMCCTRLSTVGVIKGITPLICNDLQPLFAQSAFVRLNCFPDPNGNTLVETKFYLINKMTVVFISFVDKGKSINYFCIKIPMERIIRLIGEQQNNFCETQKIRLKFLGIFYKCKFLDAPSSYQTSRIWLLIMKLQIRHFLMTLQSCLPR